MVCLKSIWTDSLTFPVYVALASAVILVCHIIFSRRPVRRFWRRLSGKDASDIQRSVQVLPQETTLVEELQERMGKHGGATIFAFKLARVLGCIFFLGLNVYSTILDEESRVGGFAIGALGKKKHPKQQKGLSAKEWQDLALCLTSVRRITFHSTSSTCINFHSLALYRVAFSCNNWEQTPVEQNRLLPSHTHPPLLCWDLHIPRHLPSYHFHQASHWHARRAPPLVEDRNSHGNWSRSAITHP